MSSHNGISKKKRFVKIFHNPVTAWLILGTSLALTAGAYFLSESFVQRRAYDQFDFRTREIEHAVKDRLHIYEQTLWGGVAHMYASNKVTRQQWAKYVETLDVNKHWPGIQGMGFSIPVKPEDRQAHINQIRAEGFDEYTIKPEGERDLYTAIIYLEPFDWRNKRAFGYDMWSNDMRRAAMTRARDEGLAATSGIITLVQETDDDVQRGFLTYLPVYKTKTIPKTVEERTAQFIGWVYAAFRAGDLMKGMLGSQDPNIEFQIFDGKAMTQEALLFDSNNQTHLSNSSHAPHFKKTLHLTLQGRPWTIYLSTPDNYAVGGANQPRFVAMAGLCVDLLLFYVIYALYFINKRAENMAKEMTKEVEERTEELQKTNEALEEKARDLELTSRYKSEFLANMSHELRTPLNPLLILSQLLLENKAKNLTEEQVEFAQVIHGVGNDLLKLINDILDLSKVEAGQVEHHNELVSLADFSSHMEQNFKPAADKKGLNFQTYLEDQLPASIHTDKQKVKQIVKNLLSNAFKFTERGSVTFSIYRPDANLNLSASGLDPLKAVAISVKDTGIGIPKEKEKLIFEAFQQADGTTSRKYGGTGLGLSISLEFATLLGGEIHLQSEEGRGSTFALYLPVERSDKVNEEMAEATHESQTIPAGVQTDESDHRSDVSHHIQPDNESAQEIDENESLFKDQKILLVDDDMRNVFALAPVLRKKGMEVLVGADGNEALEHLSQNPNIDLVLMDIRMPNMDGYTAMREIRKQDQFKNLPVIALTAQAMKGDKEKCLSAGASDYLSKPIDIDELSSMLRAWLDR